MHARASPFALLPLSPLPRIRHRMMHSRKVGIATPFSMFWIWMRMRMTRLSLLMRRILHKQGGRAKVAPRPARPRSALMLRPPLTRRAPSSGSPCGSASGLQAPAKRSPSAAPGAAARRRANPPPERTSPRRAVGRRRPPHRSKPAAGLRPPRSFRGLRKPPTGSCSAGGEKSNPRIVNCRYIRASACRGSPSTTSPAPAPSAGRSSCRSTRGA